MWVHAAPTMLATFLASGVEAVEALTIVLAVGTMRGWRDALAGTAVALAVLLALVLVFGASLARIPLHLLQSVIGTLLLLFGLRWLRKAILRAAGIIALHDEARAYAAETARLKGQGRSSGWDRMAFVSCFQITMLEGAEVVFIVIAIGAGGAGLLLPAAIGAAGALLLVTVLGLALRRPLAMVPENTLKFAVGVLLSAFGTFWAGEGFGIAWPHADWSLPGLVLGYCAISMLVVRYCRSLAATRIRRTETTP